MSRFLARHRNIIHVDEAAGSLLYPEIRLDDYISDEDDEDTLGVGEDTALLPLRPYSRSAQITCVYCDHVLRGSGGCECDTKSIYTSPSSSPGHPTGIYHNSFFSLPIDIACSLYPSLDSWMGIDSKQLQEYNRITPSSGAVVVAPVSGGVAITTQIQQGVRQVVGCKDPGSGKIGLSVESISKGVFVSYVQKDSIAAKAGLRFGDQILQINGQTVAGWGKSKTIDFLKKADPQHIKFAVRDRPYERTITCVKDSTGHVGFQFKKGKINAIVKDSSAARNGMLTDHYLVEVDGQNIVGLSDDKILKVIQSKTNSVTVTIMPEFVYDHMVKHLGSFLKKHMDHSVPSEM